MRKLLMDDAIGSPENSFIVRFDTTLPSLRNNVKMAIATRNNLDPSLPPLDKKNLKSSRLARLWSCPEGLSWLVAENNDMAFFQLFQYCLRSGLGTIGDFSCEQGLHNPVVRGRVFAIFCFITTNTD